MSDVKDLELEDILDYASSMKQNKEQKKFQGVYLRLTEETNALDYLQRAYQFICQAETDVLAWKRAVIALYGALYGFAICACRGTNPYTVTYKTKKGEDRLISFDKALKLCQDPEWMRMTIHSKHLELSQQQKRSIQILKDWLRNNFEHYKPTAWPIEIHGMPQVAIDVLEVIRFLALDTGNYVHLTQSQRQQIKYMVARSKRVLKQSQLYKEVEFPR